MTVQIDTTAENNGARFIVQGTHPSSPSAGHVLLYYVTGTASPGMFVEDSGGRKFGPFITGSSSQSLAFGIVTRTGGDYATGTTNFVDVDPTNVVITLTTQAHRCKIGWSAVGGNGTNADGIVLDVTVDGSRLGQTLGLILFTSQTANNNQNLSGHVVTNVLSAGSHTFKLQYAANTGGTATIRASSSVNPLIFWVEELNVSS